MPDVLHVQRYHSHEQVFIILNDSFPCMDDVL